MNQIKCAVKLQSGVYAVALVDESRKLVGCLLIYLSNVLLSDLHDNCPSYPFCLYFFFPLHNFFCPLIGYRSPTAWWSKQLIP